MITNEPQNQTRVAFEHNSSLWKLLVGLVMRLFSNRTERLFYINYQVEQQMFFLISQLN